jgi:hypothetical protein
VVVCFAVDCCTCQGKVLPSLPLRFLPSSSMQMHRQIVLDGFSTKKKDSPGRVQISELSVTFSQHIVPEWLKNACLLPPVPLLPSG